MMGLTAPLLASLWNRNRMVLVAETGARADRLFFEVRPFIPQYRQLIFSGSIPREARFIRGAKCIDTRDMAALKTALFDSLQEEELGAPPVQIVFFRADAGIFRDLLSMLDRGWIATSDENPVVWGETRLKRAGQITMDHGTISLLDPLPADIALEEQIVAETLRVSGPVKAFRVQSKQGQVHLAFKAISEEFESRSNVTQAYLQEALRLRERTLKKALEIGRRERRVDLSLYIEETPAIVVEFLKTAPAAGKLSQAVVFDGDKLIGFARYGDIELASADFLRGLDVTTRLAADLFALESCRLAEIRTTSHITILFAKRKYLFGFIPDREADISQLKQNLDKELTRLWGPDKP